LIDLIYKYETIFRLLLFVSTFSFLAFWELRIPKRTLTQIKYKRWLSNIALVVCSTIGVRLLLPAALIGVAYYAEQVQWGFAHYFELPFWFSVVFSLILLDLAIYFQHAMFHVLPVMWRFHRVHHSDLDFDFTTGLRFHPGEVLISLLIKITTIVALGAPVLAVILFEIALNLMAMFTHSNINLNSKFERVLRWFIVTPDMHRVHHSILENETNSNFAFNISLWDRIFGTYIAEPKAGQLGLTIGLEHFREMHWQSFAGLIFMPFTTGIKGYAINYRDTRNEDELALARALALQNQEKAKLASELVGYVDAIDQHALVSVTDPEGRIIQVNNKFQQISGYSLKELLGQNHSIINSGTHTKQFFSEMWTTISNGKIWHGEVCNRSKNGTLYWVNSTIVPIKNLDDKIERYISVRIDITERKRREAEIEKAYLDLARANNELEQLSRIDGLTNIANRRYFDETLSEEIKKLQRQKLPLTLLFCDIDCFKSYNDTYGHLAGDVCLTQVAESISSTFIRVGDLTARYGGEEFAVILINVDKEAALLLAERMRMNVQNLNLVHKSSIVTPVVTISVGVTTLIPNKDTTSSGLIECADKALYMAKEKGRNNVQYFE